MSTQTFSWQAPEFRHYPKNAGWYVTLICAAVLIVGFFVLEKDTFAAITTALLAGFAIFFAKQKPKLVTVELSNKALHFGNLMYPYKQLKHFWIVNSEHHKTLNFTTATYINNTIVIELEDQDPDEIRDFLLKYLPEHEDTEPTFAQKVSHKLKF